MHVCMHVNLHIIHNLRSTDPSEEGETSEGLETISEMEPLTTIGECSSCSS